MDAELKGRRSVTTTAALRSGLMAALAVLFYGGWAALANLGHGTSVALRAGLTQGVGSGTTTLIIGAVIETLYAALPPRRYRAAQATGIAASLTALLHLSLHRIAGTPEIVRAALPSIVIGYVFAAVYATKLAAPAAELPLRIVYRRSAALTEADREAVWSFFSRFVERDRRAFEDKLASTREVFLGYRRRDELVAFGAVDVLERSVEGRTHGILFTHWAALHPDVRGRNVIQRVGARYFLRYRIAHPLRPVHWLFTASTFQSYLLLARNFRTFWPRPGSPWPARERRLVNDVMADGADRSWDPAAGVLKRHRASRYREGVVEDDPGLLQHPTLGPVIRFYHLQNPGQGDGDSLACLCPLTVTNCFSWARAALVRSLRGPR
jgi:hypothetical protein